VLREYRFKGVEQSHIGVAMQGALLRPEGPKFEAEGRERGTGSWARQAGGAL